MPQNSRTPRKAAIYLRISQDREIDGLTIERQRSDCRAVAERRGWEIVGEYVDQSISATDKTKHRPGYEAMLSDYQAGMFSAIVCWEIDRLTRQPRQLEDLIDLAESRGLVVASVSGDANLDSPNGKLITRIKVTVARQEAEQKGLRQSAAQRQRARQGCAPKGMRPIGYSTSGDIIPDEAEIVRAIYRLFTRAERPESLRSLARGLSGIQVIDGITQQPKHSHVVSLERAARREAEGKEPQSIEPNGPWSPSTVLGVLRNPRYAGLSTYTPKEYQADGGRRRSWKAQIVRNEAGEPVRGQWEPIIDDETWWKAQSILDDAQRVTNASGSTRRKHLGSGLFRCGVCGGKVTGGPRGYRCPGHVMRTGTHIDEFVTDLVAARLEKPDATRRRRLLDTGDPSMLGIEAAISEQRARIARVQHDYDEGVVEGRDLQRIRNAAETRINELEGQRLTTGRAGTLTPILGAADPASAFLEASLEIRRDVIDLLMTVTLQPQPRGKKGFNPDSVVIEWR